MRFVETPIFTASIVRHLEDRSYRRLQIALMLRPEQGPLIPGAGGLRKVRWSRPGGGKRGGLRVIYYWAASESVFYMLHCYAKNEQGDLTAAQTKALGRLVREEFK
ncbi:MAG: type II toxin-antitoxin system RelE/ParE family toxin [Vicinamibacteria bacterium]|nr:type II toxin-antitoxin system RelE/ParE family toxin [Vicinamibacteria bacterium]